MNFMPRVFWRIAVFSLLSLACCAAAKPLLRPLTPDQGLSQGSVQDLLLDHDGFLWVATAGGLNRFDSTEVVQPGSAEHHLREVNFTRLLQSQNNQIFAATTSGDLYQYQPDSGHMQLFSQLTSQDETLLYPSITAIIQQDNQHLLVATLNAVYRVAVSSGRASKLFDLAALGHEDGWLRNLFVFHHYILAAAFNGVIAYDTHTGKLQYLPHLPADINAHTDNRHVKVLQLQHDRLWIGTVEGLYSIAEQDALAYLQQQTPYSIRTELETANIWQLLWQQQQVLIPTESGLLRYFPQENRVEKVLAFSDSGLGLSDNTILDIVADIDGGLWLASRDDGAYYWHPNSEAFSQLNRHDKQAPLSNDKIFSIFKDQETLWVGTVNGLNRFTANLSSNTALFVSNDPKAVQHAGTMYRILPASERGLWLSTGVGLRYFDKQTQTQSVPAVSAPELANLFDTFSYSYITDGFYLYFFREGKAYRYNTSTLDITDVSDTLNGFDIDSNSVIFGRIAGSKGGLLLTKPDEIWLWQPDKKRSIQLYRHADYLPHLNRLADTAVLTRDNQLWFGISGIGLLRLNPDTLKVTAQLTSADALMSDTVYDLQEDKFGQLWFSSHQGLGRLDPQHLLVEYFSRDDGLDTHEYNSGAATILDDGRLVYGSMRGLTLVSPSQLQPSAPPRVTITGINVLSGEFQPQRANLNQRSFTLSHSDLGITIQFSAMNFGGTHKVRYRYWLSGSSNLSYPVQRGNSVVFPQLASGEYQFHVVSLSPDGSQESAPATLTLSITPAPWLSAWALSVYALLLISIAFLYYRNRRRQHIEIRQAHDKVKQSEQRLKQALASVDSGAWEWLADQDKLYASRIFRMLGYSENLNPLSLEQHRKLIHPDDLDNFNSRWQRFLQNPETGFDCTYRLKHNDNSWLWFRDLGKASELDDANQVVKVIGTFSNITETRASQEKARLFGEAFQQTRDWVVILDETQRVQAANHSFASAFGNMEQYLDQPRTHHLGISLVRRRFYTKLLNDLNAGDHWQGEELVITPDGRERPTLINISAIAGQDERKFFVLVFTDITAQKLAEDELRYLANYDALTGLPNRALLMDRIYHGIDQAKRDKRSLALCFIDLDKFKQINDSLGHDVGDLLLKEVARRLTLTLRESDTVARLGGDEFVVLLEGYKREDNISHVARKMLSIVSEPMQFGSHTVGVSPSIGIAVYPDDALNSVELLKHADVAMYHAKEAGRNNFQFFTAEMNEKAHMRLARETRLRSALKNKEFVNYYQPIVNSQTRQVVGAEVLLRWHSAEGVISPAEFIPLAEELRLIINMTNVLLEQALSDLQKWHRNGHLMYLSVNLSPQHLEQASLADFTRQLLKKYDIPANCLRFEVTENGLMRDHQSAIDTMLSLSFLGVQLALDDFGTGYSSLKYLKELPIDGIKIDRSFVQDIGIDSSDETIIDAMLSMASSLGMYCIAEGVETEQQLAFFQERHCYLIQGYLFGRPMPAEQMSEFLQQAL